MKNTLEQQLQHLIASLDNGEKLPSLRKLADQFNSNILSTQRCLAKMTASGQIFTKPRSGFYKAMPIFRKLEILLFDRHIIEGEFTFHKYFFNTMVTHLLCGRRQVRVHLWDHNCKTELLQGCANPDDSIVLTYRLGPEQLYIEEELRKRRVPHIHIIPNIRKDLEIGTSIRLDDEETIRTQLDFLLSRGHRRIAGIFTCSPGQYVRVWEERLNAFCRLSAQLDLELHPEYLIRLNDPEKDIDDAIAGFRQSTRPPTAILFGDRYAPFLYRAIRKNGMEPGREIALLGSNDMPWSKMLSPKLSCIRISPDSLEQHLDALIVAFENGNHPDSVFLEQQIVERETVCVHLHES